MDPKRPICHEAGHTIAALHLGFSVERVEVFEGMPVSRVALESSPKTDDFYVVLAGGIAAELLVFGDYDFQASTNDRNRISENGGGAIATYLPKASDIMHSHKDCLDELRGQITRNWIVEQAGSEAEANFNSDSRSLSFVLLSRGDIEAIWGRVLT